MPTSKPPVQLTAAQQRELLYVVAGLLDAVKYLAMGDRDEAQRKLRAADRTYLKAFIPGALREEDALH